MVQAGQGREILDYPGSDPAQGDSRGLVGFAQVQLCVSVAENGPDRRYLMQQSSFKLPRFDFILLACELIDHRHADLRVADPVPQLRGQIPLDFLPAQGSNSLEQRTDFELRAFFRE